MTEADWLACNDHYISWDHLAYNASPRKRRLFACACCRNVWHLLDEQRRAAVELAEQYADGEANAAQLAGAFASLSVLGFVSGSNDDAATENSARGVVIGAVANEEWQGDAWSLSIGNRANPFPPTPHVQARLRLLRELVGNHFRRISINPVWLAWNGGTVLALAQDAYEKRILPAGTLDPQRLCVLTDALEEAGCEDSEILSHLREPGHVRGCWVVDALLGKT